MKYKCIIADDEEPAIRTLEDYIQTLEHLENIGTCYNAFQAFDILTKEKIDLIFLDITMQKLLGALLLKSGQHPPKIIFTAPNIDHTKVEFEPNVIDYLSKPFSYECFLISVIRFCDSNKVKTTANANFSYEFLYFRVDRKMVKVLLNDITYVESFKDYIVIHRQNDSKLKVKYAISSVENMLPPNLFLRIHRSYIVSVSKITAFTYNYVEIGETELPIGRSYHDIYQKLAGDSLFLSNENHMPE